MIAFKKRHKTLIQAVALALTVLAVLPIYAGLQGGTPDLNRVGLLLVGGGMGIGLWVS